MARVFVTSDLHLGHDRLIERYRGFSSAEEYFEILKKNWNSVVTKRDKVFVLGDITMEKVKHYHLLSQLNGNKVFILGNHDPAQQKTNSLLDYGTVAGMIKYKGYWLTHAPIHPSELRGKKNIHGHTHYNKIRRWWGRIDKRYINACLDVNNYTPVEFMQLVGG